MLFALNWRAISSSSADLTVQSVSFITVIFAYNVLLLAGASVASSRNPRGQKECAGYSCRLVERVFDTEPKAFEFAPKEFQRVRWRKMLIKFDIVLTKRLDFPFDCVVSFRATVMHVHCHTAKMSYQIVLILYR